VDVVVVVVVVVVAGAGLNENDLQGGLQRNASAQARRRRAVADEMCRRLVLPMSPIGGPVLNYLIT